MASPGDETGAGHGVGGVNITSIMAETDLERRVLKLYAIYILWTDKKGKDDIKLGEVEEEVFNGEVAGW
jgi:hypothetical protein